MKGNPFVLTFYQAYSPSACPKDQPGYPAVGGCGLGGTRSPALGKALVVPLIAGIEPVLSGVEGAGILPWGPAKNLCNPAPISLL
jgi:hypothetical protein